MRVEVIECDIRGANNLHEALNDWLEVTEDQIRIEHTQVVGPDVESCKFLLIIFYELKSAPLVSPTVEGQKCRQCKKRPAIEGQKQCEECKAYQKKYREERKAAKNTRYP